MRASRLGAWIVLAAAMLPAQITRDLLDGTTPPGIAPGAAVGSYSLSNLESVNLFSGGLGFAVPLARVGGRGEVGYTISMPIETRWIVTVASGSNTILYPTPSGTRTNFVGYSPGYMEARAEQSYEYCGSTVYSPYALLRLHWISPDGNDQEFIDRASYGASKPTGLTCPSGSVQGSPNYFNRQTEFVSTDGSAMTFISDTNLTDNPVTGTVTGYLMQKDGTRYRIVSSRVTWMTDRHGNQITFNNAGDAYQRPVTITDPLGRVITIEYSNAYMAVHPNEDWIRIPGAVERIVKVRYAYLTSLLRDAGWTVKQVKQLFTVASYPPPQDNVNSDQHNPLLVSEIELPNGQKYSFKYNSYGELSRAVLPTGGIFEYDWASRTTDPDGIYGDFMVYRRLTERRKYTASGVMEGKTVYTAPMLTVPGDLVVTATEQDLGGNPLRKQVMSFWGTPLSAQATPPLNYPKWKDGKSKQEEVQTAAGAMVQRTVPTWRQRDTTTNLSVDSSEFAAPSDPRIVETQRTTGSVMSKVTTDYSVDPYNNIAEQCDYDFGAAQPSRCRRFTYETATSYTTPLVHLRSLVTNEMIGPGKAAAFVKEAETQYQYDQYGASNVNLTNYADIANHDPARRQSYITRGNVTTTRRWHNVTNSYFDETTEFDIAGNVKKVTKPAIVADGSSQSPVTTVSYADNFTSYGGSLNPPAPTYAFPTSIIQPGGFTVSARYHFRSGSIVQFTDPNGRITKYEYGGYNLETGGFNSAKSDPLDRLTTVVHPIGQTDYYYIPSQNKVQTQRRILASPSTFVTTESIVDGLGRPWKSIQYESGASITRESSYDALGRLFRVHNPYRTSQGSSVITSFDELDRPLDVTLQDGSVARTRYTNNEAIIRDSAGKWRKTVSDGLGRLQTVIESPLGTIDTFSNSPGLNLYTSYTYDSRDNLKSVTQGGRNRSFTWDSLSRLKTVQSPETGRSVWENEGVDENGTTSFNYDALGNLIERIDPRGAVTTYAYEIRGRLRSKSYAYMPGLVPGPVPAVSPSSTASVTFCYDGATTPAACSGAPTEPTPGAKNLKGRMTLMSSSDSATTYSEYDALGRIRRSAQTVNGLSGTYNFEYTYNELEMDAVIYPSGRRVSYGFDAAGRVSTVTGLNGSTTTNYVTSTTYESHGAVSVVALNGGRHEARCYNAQLQVSHMLLRTAAPSGQNCTDTTSNLLKLQLGYGPAASNNGNVRSQTIVDGAASLAQTYEYDDLNRLKSIEEPGTTSFKQTYDYDAWGNRWIDTTNSYGLTIPSVPTSSSWYTSKNRLLYTAQSYDRAGNLRKLDPFTANYDMENRMTDISSPSNGSASFSYDGEGRRVRKTVGTWVTYYIYTARGELAAEYETSRPATAPPARCSPCYVFEDHLGSTRALWDGSGLQARMDYLPFGGVVPADRNNRSSIACAAGACYDSSGSLTQKFTGKERDGETGLDYFGARYMSAAQGRFTSPDKPFADQHPEDPQSWNLYSYVRNNPLAHVDTDGHACFALNKGSAFCGRATEYGQIDARVSGQTRFFAAASAVSQALANADVGYGGFMSRMAPQISGSTQDFLGAVGQDLLQLNRSAAADIQSGKMSGPDLDSRMVHMEQSKVQGALDNLKKSDPAAYQTLIKESNAGLNPTGGLRTLGSRFATDKAYLGVLDGVRKQLGRDIDFSKQSDREAIGNALIQHIRKTGGCDVAGDKLQGCH